MEESEWMFFELCGMKRFVFIVLEIKLGLGGRG